MLTKFRDNLFIGDENATYEELKSAGITSVVMVSNVPLMNVIDETMAVFFVTLHDNKINKPHVKDIACHIPKYMMQNGEIVAVISKTGLVRAAFVACRTVCELESRSIYEVMVELKGIIPEFDLGKAYL